MTSSRNRVSRLLAVVAALLCAGVARGQSPTELPDGTTMVVQLEQSIRADRAKIGDIVRAKLLAPVLLNGAVAVPEGANIFGVILEAAPLSSDKPSRLSIRFQQAQWRDGNVALNAYLTRHLLMKRTYGSHSREFCLPVERLLPSQPFTHTTNQQSGSQSQQKSPPPAPPPVPDVRYPPSYLDDACHSPTGASREDASRLVFTTPRTSDIALHKLEKPSGATLLESKKKTIALGKGMLWEIRHVALH